ncbi:MAG: sulfotransferase family 2 domain-containing protein [Rivularia sp. (in: cyanobacteria)]
MLISYTNKFIFFHVTKVAGTSIKKALQDYAEEPDKFKIKRPVREINGKPNRFYEVWQSSLWHAQAKEVKKELTESIYDNLYKFAFVRNPWDWHVSYYHFILKEPTHIRYEFVSSMSGFEEYLEWVINTKNPFPKGTTKLQKDIITDDNDKVIVDFIGRYETLVKDFNHVCQILNIEVSLPHLNSSRHRNYRSYYNAKTRQLVADNFGADIELFGYTFDG